MTPSQALESVELTLTALNLRDAEGDLIEGLCAVPVIIRELTPAEKEQWSAFEDDLEFAAQTGSEDVMSEAAGRYCRGLTELIQTGTIRLRKRQVERETRALSFCAREES